MYKMILCEGETDAILISYYLMHQFTLRFCSSSDKFPIIKGRTLYWYTGADGQAVAICVVGSCNFAPVLKEFKELNRIEPCFSHVVLLTDQDDEQAGQRFVEAGRILSEDGTSLPSNQWKDVHLQDKFQADAVLHVLCLFMPLEQPGALETFVVNMLADVHPDNQQVVTQVDGFLKNFHSQRYLQKRREKTKARLSLTLSVFSPDRTFTTLDEYMKQVPWDTYTEYNQQFALLQELGKD